eukprot:gb/GECH01014136.1/.p1 GENE.gb/GECH01014136.1/~~gb/GECH01014136.1/.p1  ORF type:complete len:172 (+),score=40.22 gb/GECH01014136.1/:1-516(+)
MISTFALKAKIEDVSPPLKTVTLTVERNETQLSPDPPSSVSFGLGLLSSWGSLHDRNKMLPSILYPSIGINQTLIRNIIKQEALQFIKSIQIRDIEYDINEPFQDLERRKWSTMKVDITLRKENYLQDMQVGQEFASNSSDKISDTELTPYRPPKTLFYDLVRLWKSVNHK